MPMKILIVEDEPKVASFIRKGIEENNYDAETASDGLIAEKMALVNKYDLFILDLIIPGITGLELCKKLKKLNPEIPVLMLTALGTTDDKIIGFEAGADDYLVKPFEFRELLARVKVLLKKNNQASDTPVNKLFAGDVQLDLDKKVVLRGNTVIDLTAKEFSLLEYFMRNSGRVLSRIDIAEKVWDIRFDSGTNVVDVYVNFLRKKIDKGFDKKMIHTRVGFGYVFGEQ
jgi:two-component system, OmpR family, copper resistance phosphate regulon response regulator CusR